MFYEHVSCVFVFALAPHWKDQYSVAWDIGISLGNDCTYKTQFLSKHCCFPWTPKSWPISEMKWCTTLPILSSRRHWWQTEQKKESQLIHWSRLKPNFNGSWHQIGVENEFPQVSVVINIHKLMEHPRTAGPSGCSFSATRLIMTDWRPGSSDGLISLIQHDTHTHIVTLYRPRRNFRSCYKHILFCYIRAIYLIWRERERERERDVYKIYICIV